MYYSFTVFIQAFALTSIYINVKYVDVTLSLAYSNVTSCSGEDGPSKYDKPLINMYVTKWN